MTHRHIFLLRVAHLFHTLLLCVRNSELYARRLPVLIGVVLAPVFIAIPTASPAHTASIARKAKWHP
jgi:uncharacterized membrane protein